MSDTTTPVDPSESMSLSDHEQTYVHPEGAPAAEPQPAAVPESEPVTEPAADESKPADRDDQGRFKPREKHRSQKQIATAADVPRIAELTKKAREAERRAEEAEKRIQEYEARLKATPKPEPPKEFTDAEPKYEDFANEPDQYNAWMKASAAYEARKALHTDQKTRHDAEQAAAIEARNKQRDIVFKEKMDAHWQRMERFRETRPEDAKFLDERAEQIDLNPVMLAAVLWSENSDQLMLRLAQDQDLVDDLHVLTDDKSPSKDLVERVQRRMQRGLQVAATGSTAPAPVVPALPRPPNPVRTGVMKPADTPPGDDASLAEHERAYGYGGRRRR